MGIMVLGPAQLWNIPKLKSLRPTLKQSRVSLKTGNGGSESTQYLPLLLLCFISHEIIIMTSFEALSCTRYLPKHSMHYLILKQSYEIGYTHNAHFMDAETEEGT